MCRESSLVSTTDLQVVGGLHWNIAVDVILQQENNMLQPLACIISYIIVVTAIRQYLDLKIYKFENDLYSCEYCNVLYQTKKLS